MTFDTIVKEIADKLILSEDQVRPVLIEALEKSFPKVSYSRTPSGREYAVIENWTMPPITNMGSIRWFPFTQNSKGDCYIYLSMGAFSYSIVVDEIRRITLYRLKNGE